MIFKELSNIIGYIKDFFLKARVGIGIVIRVFKAVEIARVLEIIGVVETGAASDTESSYARHGKTVS